MKSYSASAEEYDDFDDDDYLVGVEEVSKDDSTSGFPDEHMQPLRGLLFVGSLSKNFMYAGHEFLIETLTEGDVLRVGQMMSEYRGTFSESEARKCFTVAACVKSVDGYAIVTDIEPTSDNLPQKADIVKRWYPPVIDYIYRRYSELESSAFAVASSLKK